MNMYVKLYVDEIIQLNDTPVSIILIEIHGLHLTFSLVYKRL